MRCKCKSSYFVALPFLILIPTGLFICYGIALANNRVNPVPEWPFLGLVGNDPPQSCIFSLFFTWAAFSFIVTAYYYFKYVKEFAPRSKCNTVGLVFGWIVSFGLTLIASFQVQRGVLAVYVIGHALGFVGFVVYSWVVVYLSWIHLSTRVYGKGIVFWRTFIAIAETMLVIIFIVAIGIFLAADPEDRSPTFASVTSWCLVFMICVFFGTLIYDLCHIRRATTAITLHDLEEEIIDEVRIASSSAGNMSFRSSSERRLDNA